MKNIDLTYIIPTILSILSFIVVLFYGKNKVQKDSHIRILRYIPILSVFALIIGVFVISKYYQDQLNIERNKFNKLQTQVNYNDSILLNNKSKKRTLDSLKILDKELNRILHSINKQEKITGENSDLKDKVKSRITATNEDIGTIESYNEIIDEPTFLKKGYMSGEANSNILFICPTDNNSEYLDLKLRFKDEKIIDKIACIFIEVTEVKNNGENWREFAQAYKAKEGVNAFKIKNYLRNKNMYLEIGYILKSETKNEYPIFQKITCK